MKTDPAAALQHTRCIQALTAIGICTDSSVIDVSGLGALEKQIAKVKRWRDAAAQITTKHRKLSAGARRDLDAMFHRMADALASLASPDDNTKFLTWGGYIYAAELLVWDCLNTCPQYAHGNEWRWLQQSAYTLSRQLEALDPAVAVHGTEIYEDIAPRDGAFLYLNNRGRYHEHRSRSENNQRKGSPGGNVSASGGGVREGSQACLAGYSGNYG